LYDGGELVQGHVQIIQGAVDYGRPTLKKEDVEGDRIQFHLHYLAPIDEVSGTEFLRGLAADQSGYPAKETRRVKKEKGQQKRKKESKVL